MGGAAAVGVSGGGAGPLGSDWKRRTADAPAAADSDGPAAAPVVDSGNHINNSSSSCSSSSCSSTGETCFDGGVTIAAFCWVVFVVVVVVVVVVVILFRLALVVRRWRRPKHTRRLAGLVRSPCRPRLKPGAGAGGPASACPSPSSPPSPSFQVTRLFTFDLVRRCRVGRGKRGVVGIGQRNPAPPPPSLAPPPAVPSSSECVWPLRKTSLSLSLSLYVVVIDRQSIEKRSDPAASRRNRFLHRRMSCAVVEGGGITPSTTHRSGIVGFLVFVFFFHGDFFFECIAVRVKKVRTRNACQWVTFTAPVPTLSRIRGRAKTGPVKVARVPPSPPLPPSPSPSPSRLFALLIAALFFCLVSILWFARFPSPKRKKKPTKNGRRLQRRDVDSALIVRRRRLFGFAAIAATELSSKTATSFRRRPIRCERLRPTSFFFVFRFVLFFWFFLLTVSPQSENEGLLIGVGKKKNLFGRPLPARPWSFSSVLM